MFILIGVTVKVCLYRYNYNEAKFGNHTTDTVQTTLTVQEGNILSVFHLGYA